MGLAEDLPGQLPALGQKNQTDRLLFLDRSLIRYGIDSGGGADPRVDWFALTQRFQSGLVD